MNPTQQSKKDRDMAKAQNRTVKRVIFWVLALLVVAGSIAGLVALVKNTQKEGTAGRLVPGLEVNARDHVKGNPNSGVVLVEYSDLQCPACRAYDPIVTEVVTEYQDRITFVYRHFPLPQHFNAKLAAAATEAAGRQGKFWEMKELLFAEQDMWTKIGTSKVDVTLVKYAERLGLNTTQFLTDLRAGDIQDKITADQLGGQKAGVSATPSFFLNGKAVLPKTKLDFQALLDQALAETNVATSTTAN